MDLSCFLLNKDSKTKKNHVIPTNFETTHPAAFPRCAELLEASALKAGGISGNPLLEEF